MSLTELLDNYEKNKVFWLELKDGFKIQFKPMPANKMRRMAHQCTDKNGNLRLAEWAEAIGENCIIGWNGLTYGVMQKITLQLDIGTHKPDEQIPFNKEDALRLVNTFRWLADKLIEFNEKIYRDQEQKTENFLPS